MVANERKVWPILAWASGGLLVVACWLGYLTAFVDERWKGFSVAGILFFIASVTIMCVCIFENATYTKRPRGWRKLRRDAERAAYIKQLEKEMGL